MRAGDALRDLERAQRRRPRIAGVAGFKSEEERKRLYLKPGDVVEAEIERIGVLRNPVVSWEEGHGEPAPPRIRPWGDDA